jgi:hypothetical protein
MIHRLSVNSSFTISKRNPVQKIKVAAAAALAAVVGVGGFNVASAQAASNTTFSRGDAEFCAKRLDNITLERGVRRSKCVQVMQDLMNKEKVDLHVLKGSKTLEEDGRFGPDTDRVVKAREKRLKWDRADGKVSVGTFESLAKSSSTPAGKAKITGIWWPEADTSKSTESGNRAEPAERKPAAEKPSPNERRSTNPPADKKKADTPKKTVTQSEKDAARVKNGGEPEKATPKRTVTQSEKDAAKRKNAGETVNVPDRKVCSIC